MSQVFGSTAAGQFRLSVAVRVCEGHSDLTSGLALEGVCCNVAHHARHNGSVTHSKCRVFKLYHSRALCYLSSYLTVFHKPA